MRLIGTLESEDLVASFGDYLFLSNIENNVEQGKDGAWEIWVHDDDQLDQAQRLFAEFCGAEDKDAFDGLRKKAARERKRRERKQQASQKAVIHGHQVWSGPSSVPVGYLTMMLIVICCGFFLLAQTQRQGGYPDVLYITSVDTQGGYVRWEKGLPEVRHGQVWRLITPIFMHFGMLHLIFNMMWLADLGRMIEHSKGTWFFLLLVVVTSVLSNLGQYIVSSPFFGGMSGVVYGMLGYVWMLSRYDPSKGLKLHQTTVTMMLVWFVLCFTGLVGAVANTAHAVGLVIGVTWGFLESGGISRLYRRL